MASSVPLAVPAFISLCQGALPASFTVKLGTIFGPYVPPQALLITGVHFTEDAYAELGPSYRHEEHYNIACALTVSQGGPDDEPDLMQSVYALYEDVSVAVANNPTLPTPQNTTGTVRLGWCRQLDYEPTYDAVKAMMQGVLTFEVECQARVTSLI